jgi:hypothetical protein
VQIIQVLKLPEVYLFFINYIKEYKMGKSITNVVMKTAFEGALLLLPSYEVG